MKSIALIVVLFVTSFIQAQSNYETGMQKAFDLWKENDWLKAEQLFERISQAEQNQWLPSYYVAQMNSLKSWTEKDITVLKAQLDKAQKHLDIAKSRSEDNPEILVLQAHIYTNWVAFDGATYGMQYGKVVSEIYNKAYTLAPDNPRVVYSRAEWNMGSARYFGGDTKPFCKDLEKALQLFATFKPQTPFHPNWGKERVEQVLTTCK